MKDATHHLKHLQKKVIQSTRKTEASEEYPYLNSDGQIGPSKPSGGRLAFREKKTAKSQLRKSMIRQHVH